MLKKLSITAIVLLSGCSSVPSMYYKDGRQAQVIRCEGLSWMGCMMQASSLCLQGGYDILEKSTYRESGMFSNTEKKEMLIICKNPGQANETSKDMKSKSEKPSPTATEKSVEIPPITPVEVNSNNPEVKK